ncbi:Cat operon transcriptional regulator [Thalassovita mediterranea]|jgi:DNA-binding transcriptional LysR family regulator|uniref:Cat operon transcriptional regulator n=2 Tax=Thalassovita mediterranea TaxID=340021 RepID=A0A0P1H653_9RHOB|nr:Cat operon transcriptional regulator [Thalassovita mediterranea]SIS32866.1 transcriptional regulator, LysR family [Thalassovita mediterranea]
MKFYMDRFSNLNNLLAFVTVAREGSVSRAAEVLSLTQPAISHQIKRLADDTGLILFERSPSGLQIAADGTAVLAKAERVLDAMAEFQRSARRQAGQVGGLLRLGTIVDPEFIRLGRLLAGLRREHPLVETRLRHGVSGDIMTWLKRGQIDAGFYLSAPDELPLRTPDGEHELHTVSLAQFSYRVIAPAGWQDQVDGADWPALACLPWIGTPNLSVHHRLLSRIFAQHGCQPDVVAQVDQEASMLEMVRSGIGLSLCRESVALHHQHASGLAVCPSVAVPASLSFTMLAREQKRPILIETLRVLSQCW